MYPIDILPKVVAVIGLLAQGRTLTAACRDNDVSPSTLKRYVAASPELQQAFDDALQEGYDTLAEILLEIDNNETYGSTDPKMAKVMSDNIKWFLSRRKPKEYGDRVSVDVTITADKTIVAALEAAKRRLPSPAPMIDITPQVVVREEDLY